MGVLGKMEKFLMEKLPFASKGGGGSLGWNGGNLKRETSKRKRKRRLELAVAMNSFLLNQLQMSYSS